MNRFRVTIAAIVLAITFALAPTTTARPAPAAGKSTVPRSAKARTPLVEFEMMTWVSAQLARRYSRHVRNVVSRRGYLGPKRTAQDCRGRPGAAARTGRPRPG